MAKMHAPVSYVPECNRIRDKGLSDRIFHALVVIISILVAIIILYPL